MDADSFTELYAYIFRLSSSYSCSYLHDLNFKIVLGSHVLRSAKEMQPSAYKEGRIDTPIDAALFLKRFSIQNMNLLKSLNVISRFFVKFLKKVLILKFCLKFYLPNFKLCTTKTYKWSNRDSSIEGTPILELIEYVWRQIRSLN